MRIIDANRLKRLVDQEWFDCQEKALFFDEIDRTPTVDRINGFKHEHLVLIAELMQKEGIGPKEVVDLLQDAGRLARKILEVRNDIIEKRAAERNGKKSKLITRYEVLMNGVHVAFYRGYREAAVAADRLQKMHRDAVVEIEDASYYD